MKNWIIIFLLMPIGIFAQEHEKKVIKKDFEIGEYAPMYVSYYGNLITHPGFKVGFDWNLLMIEKTKEKKKQIRTVRKLLLLTPSVAYYWQKDSHQGLIIALELAWRRYNRNLFYIEGSLGAGYYRIFNTGETWETSDEGTVTNIGGTSRGYFTPSISFAVGKRFDTKKNIPIEAFIKANGNVLVGYDAGFVTEFSMELGARITFDWGIKTGRVKTIIKKKK